MITGHDTKLDFPTAIPSRRPLFRDRKFPDHGHFSHAIMRLPAAFRSAMILSYLEGFSTREIADLAGVKPKAIDSLLKRGRELLKDEVFVLLVGKGEIRAAPGKVRRKPTP
jgi:hypothetical protein